jgi:hypothetical protein
MVQLIESLSQGVPAALTEVITLGRTLTKRAADVLAYFDRPGTSNGPTEAINGRLKHLRGSALGFRNLTNYIARSLLETGVRGQHSPDNQQPSTLDTGPAKPHTLTPQRSSTRSDRSSATLVHGLRLKRRMDRQRTTGAQVAYGGAVRHVPFGAGLVVHADSRANSSALM